MRQSHLILSNASVTWVTQVLQLFPQLFLVPYLIATLGDDGYGIYALVWSLLMSIEQLQMSLQQGVIKYSAGFIAQGRIDQVSRVASCSFVCAIALAALASTGTLTAAAFYNDPNGQIAPSLVVVGIMILFIIPLTPHIAIIQSMQRFYVGAIATTISRFASLLAVMLWFHVAGPSLRSLVAIMAGGLLLAKAGQLPIAYKLVPGLKTHLRLCNLEHLTHILAFGGMTLLVSLCLTLNSTGVRWLMESLVSTTFVGHLSIMLMPGILLSQIVTAVTMTVMPATSAYQATGQQGMLTEMLIRGSRYSTILALAALLPATLLMRAVLSLWLGPSYAFLAPYALTLFAGTAFVQSASVSHHVLKGLGQLKLVVCLHVLTYVLVPLAVILATYRTTRDPYLATTAGLVGGQLLSGILYTVFGARAVHAPPTQVVTRAYAQPLGVAAGVSLVLYAAATHSDSASLPGLTLLSALAVLLFLAGCHAMIATVGERQQLRDFLSAASARVAGIRGK
jgi:O-antigen/teichoic acid export membrane protein